jgi:hypothetical protein
VTACFDPAYNAQPGSSPQPGWLARAGIDAPLRSPADAPFAPGIAIRRLQKAQTPRAPSSDSKGKFVDVLWLDKAYEMHVDLKALDPLSPQLRAILAYYAMRANSNCPVGEWRGKDYIMQCGLTTALGLGNQCSAEHVAPVQKWFPDGLPSLDDDDQRVAEAVRKGTLRDLCNNVPDTATRRNQWDVIRVRVAGDIVDVHAVEAWTSGPDGKSGENQYDTTFQVLQDRVKVRSHRRK